MTRIQVDRQALTILEKDVFVAGTVGVYKCQFEFSPEWSDYSRTAIFFIKPPTPSTEETREAQYSYSILLDDSNRCLIPHELLSSSVNAIFVGVYGVNDDKVYPTRTATLPGVLGGIMAQGVVPTEPTQNVYQQILNEMQSFKKDIEEKLRKMGGI